jgi:DNA-directed RNA polymerase specialized sigma24 family protein
MRYLFWVSAAGVGRSFDAGFSSILWYERACSRNIWMRPIGETVLPDETVVDSFTEWFREAEPRLRHALSASLGVDLGKEATAEAVAYAWEHWERIAKMDNPTGYVYGTGRNKGRRMSSRRPSFLQVSAERLPWVEPGLPVALSRLPERQRVVVALLYGYQWTMSEVAELLGISKTTVQSHAQRGLGRLRRSLGVQP